MVRLRLIDKTMKIAVLYNWLQHQFHNRYIQIFLQDLCLYRHSIIFIFLPQSYKLHHMLHFFCERHLSVFFIQGYMNSITDLLDLENTNVIISDIQIQGQTKNITLETPPAARFCPSCGFRMHSRGIKNRTITHPILQDNYSLILILKQRHWRCTNPECWYDISEPFKFVNKQRRTTNAADMLIVDAYRNLLETSASVAKRFHVSDSHAHEVFDRYVKHDRLPLTDAISIDKVHLDINNDCRYALVIQDFHTGDPIDLLRSRRANITEPYFVSIPS